MGIKTINHEVGERNLKINNIEPVYICKTDYICKGDAKL